MKFHSHRCPWGSAARRRLVAAVGLGAALASATALLAMDFETLDLGSVPDDVLVLNGEFAVREFQGNKCLELPGTPLDSFGLLFGPAAVEGLEVAARIQSEAKGRLRPTFGIGLNGVGGFRLVVSPSRRAAELHRGAEESGDLLATTPFLWESGTWTRLRLRVTKAEEGTWRIEGKVWPDGSPEPAKWALSHDTTTEPIPGRPSLRGSPFSGQPIRFDNLELRKVSRP